MDNILRKEFFKLCEQRHKKGEKKYGFAYLNTKKDFKKEYIDELADAANYLSYLYVRVKHWERRLK